VHPDDLPEAEKQAKLSLQTGELHAEWRILLPDGSVRWLEARGRIIRDQQGSPRQMIGVNIDVTAAKAAEQQKELLLGELAHRVKNTLAVVQSIARQTLPKANAGVEVFLNRLYALASVHNSLTRNDWRGARLSELLNDQITPFVGTLASQFHYDGPDVFLPVEASTQIALVIHELACNASKHGSLQSAMGMISVTCREIGPALIHIRWVESGGPEIASPTVVGFGSKLLGATVKNLHRSFDPPGLVCEFDVGWFGSVGFDAAGQAAEAQG
jgi:two-component sensor histidine kinase